MMERGEYLDAVAAELKRLTPKERAAVRGELDAHIEDHAASLREHGYADEEADARATALMGDPVQVGRDIAKLYRPIWLWVERVAGVLIAVMALYMLLGLGALGSAWNSVYARVCVPDDEAAIRMDERMAVGDDVVRLYGIKGYEPGQACEIELNLCAFDRVPFGCVYQNIWGGVRFLAGEDRSERYRAAGGGGWSNEGVSYRSVAVKLEPEDTSLTLRYERFGEVAELTVDLTEVRG